MNLNIKWQRLVVEGDTCKRCGLTEEEVEKAVSKLKKSLQPLGIKVELEKGVLSEKEFNKNPKQSNLILINGRPLEEWLDADTGENECCSVCGENNCRTVIVGNKEHEAIPSELIVRAGLRAASKIKNTKCCSTANNSSKN